MSYANDDTLANDAAFRARVKMAMVNAARQIAGEARTVRNLVDAKRNALAVNVMDNPPTYLDRFVHTAIETGTLTSSSTDANIDSAISACWNFLAGVTVAELA